MKREVAASGGDPPQLVFPWSMSDFKPGEQYLALQKRSPGVAETLCCVPCLPVRAGARSVPDTACAFLIIGMARRAGDACAFTGGLCPLIRHFLCAVDGTPGSVYRFGSAADQFRGEIAEKIIKEAFSSGSQRKNPYSH